MDAVNLDKRFMRQLGFFNPSEHPQASVSFVGVGGIGSFAAFATAKLGVPNIALIDYDTVEEHNAPNQLHAVNRLGLAKVEALAETIEEHIGTIPETYGSKITESGWEDVLNYEKNDPPLRDIVVSGFDSMTARTNLWEAIKFNPAVQLYIDGRIAGQLILIYAFNPMDVQAVAKYEETLHSDDEAEAAPCTERGVIDVGFQCGALISRMIRQHYAGESPDAITYVDEATLSVSKGDWL